MNWLDAELVLVALAAMVSPTTLTFSVLALVLGDRPLRTGLWFYLGALTATLAIGVAAAFVLGDVAASSSPSSPKTWVCIFDIVAAVFLVVWGWRLLRRPPDQAKIEVMVARMSKVASSPVIAIVGAGAVLANPGGFIPLALKAISQLNPSAAQYVVDWLFFTLVSLLPLLVAIILLVVARDWAVRLLHAARDWLVRRAWTIAAVLVFLLAASLLRNGIAGSDLERQLVGVAVDDLVDRERLEARQTLVVVGDDVELAVADRLVRGVPRLELPARAAEGAATARPTPRRWPARRRTGRR